MKAFIEITPNGVVSFSSDLYCGSISCTVMPMCVFVAHVLYFQCMLGPRAKTGRHVD